MSPPSPTAAFTELVTTMDLTTGPGAAAKGREDGRGEPTEAELTGGRERAGTFVFNRRPYSNPMHKWASTPP